MIEVIFLGIKTDPQDGGEVLLLSDLNRKKCLPIWIGTSEASTIKTILKQTKPLRPLTHSLIIDILSEFQSEVEQVVITDLDNMVYYAEIYLNNDITVSARPSDAISIALTAKVPIFVDDQLLAEVGIDIPEVKSSISENDINNFIEFIDNVSPEDFKS